MQSLVNKEEDKWLRPWELSQNEIDLNRDERFFSLLVKGTLSWLNRNIVMYGKPIKHFIFNTGSSYLYLENNDSSNDWCETSGENLMYMERPRCIVTLGNISVPTEELGSISTTVQYERVCQKQNNKGQISTYIAEMQRMPIELQIDLKYVFDTFNESLCFVQEILEKILFQKYFKITYLGQTVQCSIEFSKDSKIEFNQIDLASKDPNQKTFDMSLVVHSNLPVIDESTEFPLKVISEYKGTIYDKNEILGEYKDFDKIL